MTLAYETAPVFAGIRSRFVHDVNGLDMHVLEAGFETPGRETVLLLHGFPELAWSWRHVMVRLADAGWHVIAPDQRGYGRTTGWSARYHDDPIAPFSMLGLARDALALLAALGLKQVRLVGHDFGSFLSGWCALIRPDVFRTLTLMSAPFRGPPAWPAPGQPAATSAGADIDADLASLPRPRKHYQWYYSEAFADADMCDCAQGLHDFLRAYYHVKSADWAPNRPFALKAWTAEEIAQLPTYYVMDRAEDMAQTVAHHMPTAAQIAACRWLPDDALAVYSAEFARTRLQGGLQWYRCRTDPVMLDELRLFAGRTIDVPACYLAGRSDWGIHQSPGAFEAMNGTVGTRWHGSTLIDGAGHWVQQEQPDATVAALLDFFAATR
jgi:pimeloyl-ACP methyl ester carboxylesterase